MDFNPVVDRIRVVNANNENYRINLNTGALAGDDVNLTYSGGATGPVTAVAYDLNVAPGPPGTPAPRRHARPRCTASTSARTSWWCRAVSTPRALADRT